MRSETRDRDNIAKKSYSCNSEEQKGELDLDEDGSHEYTFTLIYFVAPLGSLSILIYFGLAGEQLVG